jgi:hypothetical protein
MKVKTNRWIILGLIVVVVLQFVFRPHPTDLNDYIKINGKEYILLTKQVDTVYEVKYDTVKEYVPQIKWQDKIVLVETEVPADIDTTAILKDYYTKKYYEDIVPVSTYGFGTIKDTVSKNQITSRKIEWDLTVPIVKETITVKEKPRTKVWIGGGMGFDKVNFINNVRAGFLLKTPRDKIYGLDIGFTNVNNDVTNVNSQVVPYIGGSLYWKIKLKKDK